MSDSAALRFVRAHTRPTRPAGLPELTLALAADDAIDVWQASREWRGVDGDDPPFWAFAWPGGVALARWCLDHPDDVAGRRVVDVATGSGVAAIAASLAGAAAVEALDVSPVAVAAARANAAANGVRVSVVHGDVTALAVGPGDVVLAGDVFYDRDMTATMLAALGTAAAAGARVLVGDPQRSMLPWDRLVELGRLELDVDADLEGRPRLVAVVCELVRTSRSTTPPARSPGSRPASG